jgi:hypothetical protein
VEGNRPRVRLRKMWKNMLDDDMRKCTLLLADAKGNFLETPLCHTANPGEQGHTNDSAMKPTCVCMYKFSDCRYFLAVFCSILTLFYLFIFIYCNFIVF